MCDRSGLSLGSRGAGSGRARWRRLALWGALTLGTAPPAVAGVPASAAASASAPAAVALFRERTGLGLAPRVDVKVVHGAAATHLATLAVPRDAVVRGDVFPGAAAERPRVALVADEQAGNADFGAALHLVDAGRPRRLATGLVHASRPLVVDASTVVVQRGFAGPWPTREEARAGLLRVDALELDAVDVRSGAVRVLTTWTGYAMHLAGVFRGALVVYRVGPRGADLALVELASGKARSLAPVLPFARDFSLDAAGVLFFGNRHATDTNRWVVERVDLAGGARRVVAEATDDAQTPLVTWAGDLWLTATARSGLRDPAGATRAPFGVGYTYATAATRGWLALAHVPRERAFDRAALYEVASGRVVELGGESARAEVIGFVDDLIGGDLR